MIEFFSFDMTSAMIAGLQITPTQHSEVSISNSRAKKLLSEVVFRGKSS